MRSKRTKYKQIQKLIYCMHTQKILGIKTSRRHTQFDKQHKCKRQGNPSAKYILSRNVQNAGDHITGNESGSMNQDYGKSF